jgi:hypothetical protein
MIKPGWHLAEEKFLLDHYATKTIKELSDGLKALSGKTRSDDSINAKIKRLKAEGKIKESKQNDAIYRSLIQRRQPYNGKQESM